MSNGLDTDQERPSVNPDLLSVLIWVQTVADDKSLLHASMHLLHASMKVISPCRLMEFSVYFDTVKSGWSITNFLGVTDKNFNFV